MKNIILLSHYHIISQQFQSLHNFFTIFNTSISLYFYPIPTIFITSKLILILKSLKNLIHQYISYEIIFTISIENNFTLILKIDLSIYLFLLSSPTAINDSNSWKLTRCRQNKAGSLIRWLVLYPWKEVSGIDDARPTAHGHPLA